jgi:hypothetical protein
VRPSWNQNSVLCVSSFQARTPNGDSACSRGPHCCFSLCLRLPPTRKAQWIVSRSWRRMGKFRKMLPSKRRRKSPFTRLRKTCGTFSRISTIGPMAVHHLRRQEQRSPGIGNCLCMDQRRRPDQISHRTRLSGHATGVDRNRIQGTSYSRLESATFTRRRHTRQNQRVYGRFYVEALLLLQRSCDVTASLA